MSVAATGESYDHVGRGWWEVPDVCVPHPKALSGRFSGDVSYHTRLRLGQPLGACHPLNYSDNGPVLS